MLNLEFGAMYLMEDEDCVGIIEAGNKSQSCGRSLEMVGSVCLSLNINF